jgi:transposase InsO family protein
MNLNLHPNARTTPAIRKEIQQSQDSISTLAKRYGVTKRTIERWRKRESVLDRSHCPHRLQTTLSPAQEAILVHIRKTYRLALDDLTALCHEFIDESVLRSSIHRMLVRHGENRLPPLAEAPGASAKGAGGPGTFKAYEPGFIHIDIKFLPKMADQEHGHYLFVAIDRATRLVYFEIFENKTAANAATFLKNVHAFYDFTITKLLTDNGKEFTDRFVCGGERTPTGEHVFDQLCAELGIEHRLIKPYTPKTNGMVERFNGRIADLLRTHHFKSGEDLAQTLERYRQVYNHHLPQKALGHQPPVAALENYRQTHPHLFTKSTSNHQRPDT